MVLLDIDYITRGEKAVIRLFGREKNDADENSIIVLDDGFQPYIYVVPHDLEQCHEQIKELDVLKVERV
ncbi:MAG: DNA polymerase, partial [Methanobacterium sp.]|nr:DNA polymerase [Methanobacterium sp.]